MVRPQFVSFETTRVHNTKFAGLALTLSVSSADYISVKVIKWNVSGSMIVYWNKGQFFTEIFNSKERCRLCRLRKLPLKRLAY